MNRRFIKSLLSKPHFREYYAPLYPDITLSVMELKNGSLAFVEPIICYLERDVYSLGSGYLKEKIWRYLVRIKLTEKQKGRLRQVALHYVKTRISREFYPMCRFIREIADDKFATQVHELQNSSDQKVQRRAIIMSAYLQSISQGEQARSYFHDRWMAHGE
jgi:hypothetical protein